MIRINYHLDKKNRLFANNMTIQLSNDFLMQYQIKTKEIKVKFGTWVQSYEIVINNHLSKSEISLPSENQSFKIPKNHWYDMKINDGILHVGPFIVYIAKKKFSQISMKRLEEYKKRFDQSHDNSGLLLICASDSIDITNHKIKGYYSTAKGKQEKDRWEIGVFPFPDTIIKKVRIPNRHQSVLLQATDHKLFNTNSFNKFELWRACSINEEIKKHLPHTKLFKSKEQLIEMLQLFDSLYFKPINGMQGKGIFVVSKAVNGYLIKKNKNETTICESMDELLSKLENLLIKEAYLIQQAVPTVYKNKQFDFRLYFQKNENQDWICQGVIGRVAQEDSIITNLNQIAHLTSGERAIRIVYKVNEEQAQMILKQTIEACKDVCEWLNKKLGHYGDVALDVVIDHQYKPWILEVNNSYGKKSLHVLNEKDTINKLHSTPFDYARSLAGFKTN